MQSARRCPHDMTMRRRNPDTLKRLNETERKMKEKKLQDYINMDLSNEEREKGNQVRPLWRSQVAPRQQWLHAHVLSDIVKPDPVWTCPKQ